MSIAFTDPYIRNLKIKGRYTDSATQGLNIQVKVNGAKYWTLRYLYQGKRHDLGLGTYPAITLKDARASATAARNEINQGARPIAKWKPTAPVNQPAEPETRPTFSNFAKSCIDSICLGPTMKPAQAAAAATLGLVYSHSFEIEYQNKLGG